MGADLPLTFQAHPDQRQISVAIRHTLRRRVAVLRVIAGLMVVWGAVFGLFLGLGVIYLVYFTILALALGVGCPELAVWRSTRASIRLVVRPTHYRFDQDGFGLSTDLAQSGMRWAAVTAVDHLPGQVLLRLSKLQFISVPTSGLTADQATELQALLRDHVTSPPADPLSPLSGMPVRPFTAPSAAPGTAPTASGGVAPRGIRPPTP
jgi:hypothetical protein